MSRFCHASSFCVAAAWCWGSTVQVKANEREALMRLIEYARLEAEEQRESFAAYLLALACRAIEPPPVFEAELRSGRMQ